MNLYKQCAILSLVFCQMNPLCAGKIADMVEKYHACDKPETQGFAMSPTPPQEENSPRLTQETAVEAHQRGNDIFQDQAQKEAARYRQQRELQKNQEILTQQKQKEQENHKENLRLLSAALREGRFEEAAQFILPPELAEKCDILIDAYNNSSLSPHESFTKVDALKCVWRLRHRMNPYGIPYKGTSYNAVYLNTSLVEQLARHFRSDFKSSALWEEWVSKQAEEMEYVPQARTSTS